MKKIFTLCVLFIVVIRSNSQVVLNEVYTDPGNGKHEFFELYNTTVNATGENLGDYTLISYYEESGKTGFYVLDFPNQTIYSKSFATGAAASPFNIQGQSGLTASFSWNALPAGGQLTKWEKNGSSYTSVSVPANLNDMFVKKSGGSGASYHVFLFKNGTLINGIIGGSAGPIPSYITSMPTFTVGQIGFAVDFNNLSVSQIDFINSNTGSDNGYYRTYNGFCGVWTKSASGSDHTPNTTNGSPSTQITMTGFINGSSFTYNISGGPAGSFPLVAEVYRDLGTIGTLDENDVLVNSTNLATSSAGQQQVALPGSTSTVLLVAKTQNSCYDHIMAFETSLSTLPVHLISFQGNLNKNNKVTLTWTAAENETVDHFEVERSTNGKDFTTAALVFATEKRGNEDYMYFETINSNDKVMFRLKMFDKDQDIDYSKILVFQTRSVNSNEIKIYGNPVKDKLTFSYASTTNQTTDVKVYDFAGKAVMSQKVSSQEGSNMVSLPLQSTFKPGMYVVEVSNGNDRQIAKFVKQ